MKTRSILFFLLFLTGIASAQKKKQETAAPEASSSNTVECTIAFYLQDSVAYKLPGMKQVFDSLAVRQKQLEQVKLKMDTARDEMLRMKSDSLIKTDKEKMKKAERAVSRYAEVTADSLILIMQIEELKTGKLQPVYDSIKIKAGEISARKNIRNVAEINQATCLKCRPEETVMVDITGELIAEMKD